MTVLQRVTDYLADIYGALRARLKLPPRNYKTPVYWPPSTGITFFYTDYAALEAALREIATIEPGAECQVGCDQIARKALRFTSSYEDALNGAWLSRGEIERLEAVLHAEHTRSSHWRGCHESHPICAYLREIQMWGDDNSPPSGEVGK